MANTTNLNLVKPAGTDKALVSVINSNMDKIDTFAGNTNQALSKVDTAYNFGQYTSLDTFKNDLLTFMQNVATFKTVAIQFVFTQTVEPFTAWSTFSGYAHCIQNGSTSLYFSCDVASNNGEDVSIGYSNGTWNINRLTPVAVPVEAGDFDRPTKTIMRMYATSQGTNPSSVLGGNQYIIISLMPDDGSSKYNAQIAFGFGSEKIAIRRKSNSTEWGNWVAIS